MTNAYCNLALLKSGGALNITGTAHDGRLLALLEDASRLIDGYCNRHFYVLHATRQFEASRWTAGMQQLLVPDLIAADSVRVAARFDGPPREPAMAHGVLPALPAGRVARTALGPSLHPHGH